MIYVNDSGFPYDKPESLTELFRSLNINTARGIAVAVNNTVIQKSRWESYLVNDNDKITLIKATQGG